MRRISAWLILVALIFGCALADAQELPIPIPRSVPIWPTASAPELPPPRKARTQPPADSAGKKGGKEEPREQKVTPIRFPVDPFPPPAPAVLDPRTGAWQQVRTYLDMPMQVEHHDSAMTVKPTEGWAHRLRRWLFSHWNLRRR